LYITYAINGYVATTVTTDSNSSRKY